MKSGIVSLVTGAALLAVTSNAALVAAPGYSATSIYTTAGSFTTLGGLDVYNGRIYSGQFTDIVSMGTDGSGVSSAGTVPSNAGNSFVSVRRSDGRVYTSFTTSYDAPAPAQTGYMNGGGFVVQNSILDGVYDAARDAAGNLYLSANDDVDGDDSADGSRIFMYNQADGGVTEIANVGGYSGGLALDSHGNLYYSVYETGKVISFSAAKIGSVLGGAAALTLADIASEIPLANPGFLAFDGNDQLYASYLDASWNTALVALDPDGKTTAIASGGGKMIIDGDTLYTIDTDWNAYSSDIYAVAIPEPSTLVLTLAGFGGMVWFRRRRKYFFSR